MRTINTIAALRAYVRAVREDGKTIGFVPTMGAFHEGHLALMRRARTDSDVAIVSLFVNPMQFGPGEDLERYPRDLAGDSKLAQQVPVDALFVPEVAEMHPAGAQTIVDVPKLAELWEGAVRPGHFRGVATICAKLFNIVQPDFAFFGRKDYQQLKIVERMVADLALPLTIVPVETIREQDGLAMSSRNAYLSPSERRAATVLSLALTKAASAFAAGERAGAALAQQVRAAVDAEPKAELDYVAIADPETLEPLDSVVDSAIALIAVRIGATRLIDNRLLRVPSPRNHQGAPIGA